jgi:hypothetical protein
MQKLRVLNILLSSIKIIDELDQISIEIIDTEVVVNTNRIKRICNNKDNI